MTDDIKHQCPPGWVAVPIEEIDALAEHCTIIAGGCDPALPSAIDAIIARLPEPPAWTKEDVDTVAEAVRECSLQAMPYRTTALSILEALAEAGRLKPVEEEQP